MRQSPDPLDGRRVRHDGTGKEGVLVVKPGQPEQYVFVRFDGADFAVPVPPDSIEFVEEAA